MRNSHIDLSFSKLYSKGDWRYQIGIEELYGAWDVFCFVLELDFKAFFKF